MGAGPDLSNEMISRFSKWTSKLRLLAGTTFQSPESSATNKREWILYFGRPTKWVRSHQGDDNPVFGMDEDIFWKSWKLRMLARTNQSLESSARNTWEWMWTMSENVSDEQLRVNVKRDNFSFDWVRLDITREQKRFMERRIKNFSDLNMTSKCHTYVWNEKMLIITKTLNWKAFSNKWVKARSHNWKLELRI